jgi:uncharacterized membrane protein
MNHFEFVFMDHFGNACNAALLSVVGMLVAYPVIKWDIKGLQVVPMWLFKAVLNLLGAHPGLLRTTLVIFCFNSMAIFLYMASGVHPLIPGLIAILTACNIAVIVSKATEVESPKVSEGLFTARWYPGSSLTYVCGLMVILLELPCFWYSIAMGMSLGSEVIMHQSTYAQGLAIRGQAYVVLIVPLLLVSAACESIAIRGMAPRNR